MYIQYKVEECDIEVKQRYFKKEDNKCVRTPGKAFEDEFEFTSQD